MRSTDVLQVRSFSLERAPLPFTSPTCPFRFQEESCCAAQAPAAAPVRHTVRPRSPYLTALSLIPVGCAGRASTVKSPARMADFRSSTYPRYSATTGVGPSVATPARLHQIAEQHP